MIRRGDDENSTDEDCFRERAVGGRLLQELFGTGLGVLCEEHSVTPAITVGEVSALALIRVVPPSFRSLAGWKPGGFCAHKQSQKLTQAGCMLACKTD